MVYIHLIFGAERLYEAVFSAVLLWVGWWPAVGEVVVRYLLCMLDVMLNNMCWVVVECT